MPPSVIYAFPHGIFHQHGSVVTDDFLARYTTSQHDAHPVTQGKVSTLDIGAVRGLMRSISGWRLKNMNYRFPVEQKLFHWYVKLTGKPRAERVERDTTSGVTPHAPA